jgi:hypothetical protein
VGAAAAMVAAYLLSDLGTGVYHWGVDNYGDASTPIFGPQVRRPTQPGQGMHRKWDVCVKGMSLHLTTGIFGPAESLWLCGIVQ